MLNQGQTHVQIQMVTHRNIYVYTHTHIYSLAHTNNFFFCQLRSPKRNDSPLATSTPSTWILVSNAMNSPIKPGSSEKRLILGWEQEIHKRSLEGLVVPERKEMLQNKQKSPQDGGCFKMTKKPTERGQHRNHFSSKIK